VCIGRTGRAGKTGIAITFFTRDNRGNANQLCQLLRRAKQPVPPELEVSGNISSALLTMPKTNYRVLQCRRWAVDLGDAMVAVVVEAARALVAAVVAVAAEDMAGGSKRVNRIFNYEFV